MIGNNKQSTNIGLAMNLKANPKTQKQNVHNKDNQFLDLRIDIKLNIWIHVQHSCNC
jgi:hypothetical protein